MANMSYCRFENTSRDFEDCLEAIENDGFDSLSENEQHYAKKLLRLSKQFAEAFDEER
jgi:hypothetical protein